VSHVVFLLESNVDDSLGDWLSNSAQELGLTNGDLKLWGEVNSISVIIAILVLELRQNVLLEVLNGLVCIIISPLREDLLLVVLVELFGKFDVFGCYVLEDLTKELIGLGLEFLYRGLDSPHD
jgi:hypothetical protein